MATFAHLAGIELPKNDCEGKPTIFDSYDMAPILFGEGTPERNHWEYFTETELAPGAIRIDQWKAVFNLRGDGGAEAGSDGPGTGTGLAWPAKASRCRARDLQSLGGPPGALRCLHDDGA